MTTIIVASLSGALLAGVSVLVLGACIVSTIKGWWR